MSDRVIQLIPDYRRVRRARALYLECLGAIVILAFLSQQVCFAMIVVLVFNLVASRFLHEIFVIDRCTHVELDGDVLSLWHGSRRNEVDLNAVRHIAVSEHGIAGPHANLSGASRRHLGLVPLGSLQGKAMLASLIERASHAQLGSTVQPWLKAPPLAFAGGTK